MSESPRHDEVVAESPILTREVASFSKQSASALKAELGLRPNDLLVGIPASEANRLGLTHGEEIKVTTDGQSLLFNGQTIKTVTHTPAGVLRKIALSKGIRGATGLKDHRETGTGKADSVTLQVIMIGDQKAVLLRTPTIS